MSILSSLIGTSLRALRQRREMRREIKPVAARFPALAALPEAIARSWGPLAAPYQEYVESVSGPVWAVSPQTAALLHALCTLLMPKRVLDLGSGFSSFVLRRHARDIAGSCTVHSVDDDAQWLDQTRAFLSAHELPAGDIFLWTEFQKQAAARYDLVLHDMGRMNTRLETLPRVLALVATEGLVVLDDMHKPEYGPDATQRCRDAGFEVCNLRAATLDSFGRYAGLGFRPRQR